MQPRTIGNSLHAISTASVLAYTIAVIRHAKPGAGVFDEEWVEHGFCVINKDVPYWNSHDLCLYFDTVLVAIGLLIYNSLKGMQVPVMKNADDYMLFRLLGHLGHGIAHGFIAVKYREDNFEGTQNITLMERVQQGDEGGTIHLVVKAAVGVGFWCGLMKGVAPSLTPKNLVTLSFLAAYCQLHVRDTLAFGYVNAVLTVMSAYMQIMLPSEKKEYSYALFSVISLVLSIIPWIEAMACQSVASKFGGHLIFDVTIPVGVTAAYIASYRHYSGKGKGMKVL